MIDAIMMQTIAECNDAADFFKVQSYLPTAGDFHQRERELVGSGYYNTLSNNARTYSPIVKIW